MKRASEHKILIGQIVVLLSDLFLYFEVIDMINIYFGHLKDELLSCSDYFDDWVVGGCLNEDFSKRVVLDIDKSELINQNLVISPVLGSIPVSDISGGAKSLITLMFTDKIVSLSAMGDNCFSLLWQLGEKKDITVTCSSFRDLYAYGKGYLKVMNIGKVVSDDESFRQEYASWRYSQ